MITFRERLIDVEEKGHDRLFEVSFNAVSVTNITKTILSQMKISIQIVRYSLLMVLRLWKMNKLENNGQVY